jgi:hypothetical protein
MRRDRLAEQVRRQQKQQQRLDEQQRMIMQVGDARLDLLDQQLAAISANSGRIAELEAAVESLYQAVASHTGDTKRHTGKA